MSALDKLEQTLVFMINSNLLLGITSKVYLDLT